MTRSPRKSRAPTPDSRTTSPVRQGWEGWDAYAPFYDWENARTLGRRDISFWRRQALPAAGAVLELGCGTGRISMPLARAGVRLVGVDRSAAMLDRAVHRTRTARPRRSSTHQLTNSPTHQLPLSFIRSDIRALPFAPGSFETVIAPYGVLQSLLADRDFAATLDEVSRVLARGGRFGLDLVPDVPKWREYSNRVQHRGPAGRGVHLTLIESVRQQPARRLTMFEQCYIERRNGRSVEHRFELTFRTLTVPQIARRLAKAGFLIERMLGDYRGGPWEPHADVWIILAKKR